MTNKRLWVVVDHGKGQNRAINPLMCGYYHEIMQALESAGHKNLKTITDDIIRVTDTIHVWDKDLYERKKF